MQALESARAPLRSCPPHYLSAEEEYSGLPAAETKWAMWKWVYRARDSLTGMSMCVVWPHQQRI